MKKHVVINYVVWGFVGEQPKAVGPAIITFDCSCFLSVHFLFGHVATFAADNDVKIPVSW